MTKPPNKTESPGTKTPRPRQPSAAEKDLWQQVTEDVEPLADYVPSDEGEPQPPEGAPPENAPIEPITPKRAEPSEPPPLRPVDPDLAHGSAPGLDRRTQTRMRRGQVDIEARIDLHGQTQDEAYRALTAFLHAAHDADRRAVLVITGKGQRTDKGSGQGVLREAVPRWLNEPEIRRMLRAFSHAAPKDGGEGALYVLLKRQK